MTLPVVYRLPATIDGEAKAAFMAMILRLEARARELIPDVKSIAGTKEASIAWGFTIDIEGETVGLISTTMRLVWHFTDMEGAFDDLASHEQFCLAQLESWARDVNAEKQSRDKGKVIEHAARKAHPKVHGPRKAHRVRARAKVPPLGLQGEGQQREDDPKGHGPEDRLDGRDDA